ncbi:hypothetical protein [Cellulomonas endometrii]|uniref:hypothetical protein n=1 Tax=Cellulomonas endometrii TaxID=3036301 RepID=UPI0024AD2C08|nr:hypothetical protein [Cellulomonas endometrii]
MTLAFDPSMLMGRRAEQWLQRARPRGLLPAIAAPAAILALGSHPTSVLGAPGMRRRGWPQRSEPLTRFASEMRPVAYQDRHPPLPEDSDLPWQSLALDVWALIVDGYTVAARRADVLDRLIRCGAIVEVRSLRDEHLAETWARTYGERDLDLLDALRRRTRLLARGAPGSAGEPPRIQVWDDGPYWAGGWQ